jgi:DNA-binding beta-propeller fold protein YncE
MSIELRPLFFPELRRLFFPIANDDATLEGILPAWIAELAKGATKTMFVRNLLLLSAVACSQGFGVTGVVMGLPARSETLQKQNPPGTGAPAEAGASQPAQKPTAPPKSKLLDSESAQPESIPLAGHKGTVHAVAFSPDWKSIATGGADGTVRVWDTATGQQTLKVDRTGEAVGVAFSPGGRSVGTAYSGKEGAVYLFDLGNGKESMRFTGKGKGGDGVAISPDGRLILAIFPDGIVDTIDAATGRRIARHQFENAGTTISAAAFSPDCKHIGLGDGGGQLYLIESATGRLLMGLGKGKGAVTALAFTADGKRVAIADGEKGLRIVDVATSKDERAFSGKDPINRLAFSHDGKLVVTAGASGVVRLWDVTSGKEERTFVAPNTVSGMVMDRDGKRLVTVGQAGSAVIWDLTGDEKPLPKDFKLTEATLASSWAGLGSDEGGKAYAALRMLRADPAHSVPFLQERLKPGTERPDEKKIRQWIADLDAEEFATREKASKELEKLGKHAEDRMRQALAAGPQVEAQKRLEKLLKLLGEDRPLSTDQERDVRAVRILEQAGTPEARTLLESLAKESRGWWVTQEAKSALQRLEQRQKK